MTRPALEIRPVESDADMQAFLHFNWTVYADDPNWVPPLFSEHKHFFDREHNPELVKVDLQYFIAWRGDKPAGVIAAHINPQHNTYWEENVGFFGAFEVLPDDQEAAHALLKTAEDWVRAKGVDVYRGPYTFSTKSEFGLLIDGHDTPPMILMPHARDYYQAYIESYGDFVKSEDVLAYYFDGRKWGGKAADKIPEKIERIVGKLEQRRNITIRKVNMRKLDEELVHFKRLYNSAWEKNWGFIPYTDEEIDSLGASLKQFVDPDITLFAEVDGEPIGVALPFPNVYEPMRLAYPKPNEPEIFALLRLIWHWKVRRQLSSVRVAVLGVLKEYQKSGVDAMLYYHMLKNGLPKGYFDIEMSWLLESNEPINAIAKMFGAEVYKRYRVYEKPLK